MANLVEEDKVENAIKQIRNSSFDEDASICILTVMKLLKYIIIAHIRDKISLCCIGK